MQWFAGRPIWSNWGPCVDIYAPGESYTAWIQNDNVYIRFTGTSVSAPMTAGVAALYLSLFPNMTQAELQGKLIATSTPGVISNLNTTPSSNNRFVFIGIMDIAAEIGIEGHVTDGSGNQIQGVVVTARDELGVTSNAITNSQGYYVIYDLEVGTYIVSASHSSYSFGSQLVSAMDWTTVDFEASQ